jgi:hypothetical protein
MHLLQTLPIHSCTPLPPTHTTHNTAPMHLVVLEAAQHLFKLGHMGLVAGCQCLHFHHPAARCPCVGLLCVCLGVGDDTAIMGVITE